MNNFFRIQLRSGLHSAGLVLAIVVLSAMAQSCSKSGGADNKTTADGSAPAPGQVLKEKPQYYKIKEVKVDPTPDATMADKGQKIFETTCTSCHVYDKRYVGPGLGGVTHRRPPEYVMNMILDTDVMVENDDTVRCLLQTYMLKMPNMIVNQDDARNVLEHLRRVGLRFDANNAKVVAAN